MRNSQQLIDSLIDAGLRIYDRDAEVGQEQGLSRSLVFANGLRFTCNRQAPSAKLKARPTAPPPKSWPGPESAGGATDSK